ncbi:vesicle-associated membrane protein 7 isoform 1-T1 [Sylvia borin]
MLWATRVPFLESCLLSHRCVVCPYPPPNPAVLLPGKLMGLENHDPSEGPHTAARASCSVFSEGLILAASSCVIFRRAAMAILFAVVARGTTILAKHAWCGGNFLEVTEQILAKIPSENNKLTYSHGNYLFHYICQDRIIYLCITDDDFERSRAFTFLNEIKKRFQTTYGSRAQTALPYAMNSEFSSVLAAQLKYHSESKGPDQVAETQAQIDELKGIMVRNIDLVAQRGEKLELLIDKTENLVDSSVTFKTTSRNLARAMCMKNLKLTIVIIIVSIVILYIILSAVCGGLAWPSCVQK